MFKRIFYIITVIILSLSFSACNNTDKHNVEKDKELISAQFKADFSSIYKNINVTGKITTGTHGMTIIDFTSPETLSGIEVTYENDQTEISFDNLKSTADEAFLPDNGLPKIIYSIVRNISDFSKNPPQKIENNNTYVFDIPEGKCVITTNDNGFLTSATINDANFKINFYNQMNIEQ